MADAIDVGCKAVMVPSTAAGELSPTHPDLDPLWDTLAQANIPFVLHVGGGGRLLDRAFHNNDRPVTDHLGGGENIRSKDFLAIHHSPELFLGALIYDGIFDKFPTLRGGCIEQGAGWVVSLDAPPRLRPARVQADRGAAAQPRAQAERLRPQAPEVHALPRRGRRLDDRAAGEELFMFSTDFPHPEGGKDPLAKFEETFATTSDDAKDRFYYRNMAELLHGAAVPA